MDLEVIIKPIPSQRVASMMCRVRIDGLNAALHEALDILFGLSARQGGQPAGAPFGIYHGPVNAQEDGPIEVCLPVNENTFGMDGVEIKEIAGGRAACVLMGGDQCDFPAILDGYEAAQNWIRKSGYTPAGEPREIWYHEQGPHARMEIQWLFG